MSYNGGGQVNANRKHNPDPPIGKTLTLPESTWKAIESVKGATSYQAWIRDAIKTALYYKAQEARK